MFNLLSFFALGNYAFSKQEISGGFPGGLAAHRHAHLPLELKHHYND